jgi:hypothetical protein
LAVEGAGAIVIFDEVADQIAKSLESVRGTDEPRVKLNKMHSGFVVHAPAWDLAHLAEHLPPEHSTVALRYVDRWGRFTALETRYTAAFDKAANVPLADEWCTNEYLGQLRGILDALVPVVVELRIAACDLFQLLLTQWSPKAALEPFLAGKVSNGIFANEHDVAKKRALYQSQLEGS